MTDKEMKTHGLTHCSHYVLGECSQEHHSNCVGTNKCIKDLEQQLQREKQKNEELKKEVSKWKNAFNVKDCAVDEAEEETELAETLNEKYKQALKEIGEIADWNCNKCKLNAWHCHSCKEVKLEQILQKVKEVTND